MTPQGSGYVHATALVLGDFGLLLRGPSGAGKSAIALQLISDWRARGAFAALVGDDRISLEARHGRLIARPHPSITGLIEARGLGLLRLDHEPACVLRAAIDLLAPGEWPQRYPDQDRATIRLSGVTLPRMVENAASVGAVARIAAYIQNLATN